MRYLIKNPGLPEKGYSTIVTNNLFEELKYIEFGILRLTKGEEYHLDTGCQEVVLVVLSGHCSIVVDDGSKWPNVGDRASVFEGRAYAAFIPASRQAKITGKDEVEIAICKAPSMKEGQAVLITPEMVKHKSVGQGNWRRDVYDIVDIGIPAEHLVVGETVNPPGNWSSSPPHKHDENNLPLEVKMEEVYFYKLNPRQGFGLQRLYTADGAIDENYSVEENDALVIPKGYHPVVAAPGYRLYYLWILGGDQRNLCPYDDPKHGW
ncbi:MAG: 5-deoxy-glucuronate isomerase, partial [Eubacteriales bacterium]